MGRIVKKKTSIQSQATSHRAAAAIAQMKYGVKCPLWTQKELSSFIVNPLFGPLYLVQLY